MYQIAAADSMGVAGWWEGTIKERVNLRLKRTGPFVELLALSDSPEWDEHWASLAV